MRLGYILKENVATMLRNKYKNGYIAEKLGISQTYVSLILRRRRTVPKHIAYSFVKVLNNDAEIEDYFERV